MIVAAPALAGPPPAPDSPDRAQFRLLQTATADFAAGTRQGTCISEVDHGADGGQLRLATACGDLFQASALDTIWCIVRPSGGFDPVIEDGILDVQERNDDVYLTSAIESRAAYEAGVVCEMRAAIHPGSAFAHVGFVSDTLSPDEWIYFGTRGTGDDALPVIMTSVRAGGAGIANVPTNITLGQWHLFRIVWMPDVIEFWVDGELIDTRAGLDLALPQRLVMYKSEGSSSPLLVDWVRVIPYAATDGSYESAVLDGGELALGWDSLDWQGELPAGTSLGFATRTGDTPVPDAGWSDWAALSGTEIVSPAGRYLQYRAELVSPDPLVSPVIDAVSLQVTFEDLIPPAVELVAPAGDAMDVPVTASVSATFSEPIDPATLTAASFTLTPQDGSPLPITPDLDASGTVATLTPAAPLSHATIYEARLTTAIADGDGNPLAADHVWTFTTEPPDLTPPTVLATDPEAHALGVLAGRPIVATFDEPVDPATVDETSFTLVTAEQTPVAATVSYDPETRRATLRPAAELAWGATYEARLTTAVTDAAGNPLVADVVWTFTTRPVAPSLLVTTSVADFAAGTSMGVSVSEVDSCTTAGQLRLEPRFDDCFTEATLDSTWEIVNPPGFVPVIENGILDVQERDDENYEWSTIKSVDSWVPGVVVEARAMFVPGSAYIDLGFVSALYGNGQYAWFSTAGTGGQGEGARIYARVREYDHTTVALETGASFNEWHVFKIVWTHGRVDFFVDGALVASQDDVIFTGPMRFGLMKSGASPTPFLVDWVRVTPYLGASGTHESPVLDAGEDMAAWLELQWSGDTPAGTGVAFATRTGDSPVPDGSWSGWAAVADEEITSPAARYLQYRAVLSTDDLLISPIVDEVTLVHGDWLDTVRPTITATDPDAGAEDVAVGTLVTATFSEPVDPATLTDQSFTLAPVGGDPVPATVSYDEATLTVTLEAGGDLAGLTVYAARISTAVTDLAGNGLASDHVWTFTTASGPVGVGDLPVATTLWPNAPNPFNPRTTIRFDLAREQEVEVRIYGVDGRLVRTLVDGPLPAGRHELVWNGRDERGRGLATGLYLLRLKTAGTQQVRKMSLIR